MIRIITLLIFVGMLAIVIMGSQNVSTPDGRSIHDEPVGKLYDADFNKLSREEQIRKCGECHKKEYQDELAGPHYTAIEALDSFKTIINSPHYEYKFYAKFLHNLGDVCSNCHASNNLFEGVLKTYESPDSLTKQLLASDFINLPGRDVKNRITGVDCMTCHFDGKGVLSAHIKYKTGPTPICNPIYSSYFSNINMTCYPCHYDEVKSLNTSIKQYGCKEMSCNSCHVKNDENGNATHFYYWTRAKYNTDNKVYIQLCNDFSFIPSTDGNKSFIKWTNRSYPHTLSLCPDLIFIFEIMSRDSTVIAESTFRVNRKKEYDKMMYDQFGKNTLGGEVGADIPDYGGEHLYPINIKDKKAARLLRIKIIKKAQYWFPDSSGNTTFSMVKSL